MRIIPHALVLGWLVACASSGSTGGGSSTSSSGGSSSGGSSSGGTGAAEPFAPKGVEKQGAVAVGLPHPSPGSPQRLSVAAFFLDYSGSNGVIPDGYSRGDARATDCIKRSAGTCEMVRCNLTPDASFALAPPRYVSAGVLTITRSGGGTPAKVSPNSELIYGYFEDDPTPFTDGETVTIAAAGDDVPAFTESMPFALAVEAAESEVDAKTEDVEVKWTNGGGNGKVIVFGETGTPEEGFVAKLTCRFDSAANKGTIPIAILEDVRGKTFELAVATDVTTKQLGGFAIDLLAYRSTVDPVAAFKLVVAQ